MTLSEFIKQCDTSRISSRDYIIWPEWEAK